MLDSKAVLSIVEENNEIVIYVRHVYREQINMFSFYKWKQTFKNRSEAKKFAAQTFPKCQLVTFDQLASGNNPTLIPL